MKLVYITILTIILFSCSKNEELVSEKPEPGLFSKDQKKGISITDFLNREKSGDKSFYVNSFLWRATLDVLSFAPFQSTDAFGGIIVTEWIKKNEKEIKFTAFVKSRELRSEGINIKVYIKDKKKEVTEDFNLAKKIENLILTKARDHTLQNNLD